MFLNIKKGVDLASLTTFKIGGKAKYFLKTKNEKDLIRAFKWAKKRSIPIFLLGGGSNILVSDKGFSGLVIKLNSNKIKKELEYDNKLRLRVGAGLAMSKLLGYSIKHNLRGMIWATGIPGTIGGGVYGNAGAHNKSIGDYVLKAKIFSKGKIKTINCKNKFSYRNSFFKKNNLIIIEVLLELEKGINASDINNLKKWRLDRVNNQVAKMTPGCIFKNVPLKDFPKTIKNKYPDLKNFKKIVPTGWLIDNCKLKGKQIGNIKISEKHANFMVNLGKGRSKEVLELIGLVKARVKKKFGVSLEREIIYLKDK
ncbi:MAG TPA: UDP-N-acetylmuramate dehydrogenase [Patescibacteria group bacterium]|nr:UDP-N-acetylmuramate dehydrogenase [Patescibacteria group bacterium]